MINIDKENLSYTFDYNKKPIMTVSEGESFTLSTEDNLSGLVKTQKDLPLPENLLPFSKAVPVKNNPLTGPVFIKGAQKGDLIEVTIEKIVPNDYGISNIIPDSGLLQNSLKWPELSVPFTQIIKHLPGPSGTTRDGIGIFNEKVSYDLAPFIGTIGVCPEFEILSSMTGQFPCAGNWDVRDIKEGSKLFLSCYHEGALLYIGDVHGSQGDTELTWSADEIKSEVTVSCKVIKNKHIPYARIEKEDSIIQLYADSPMEDAVESAITNLLEWIVEDYKIKMRDIYIMFSIIPDFRINVYQMVRHHSFKSVVGAEFPKKYLI
ncbi:MAG: acetamidase/formamidase family protein [Candidatus Humimicrobiaceae bacterium]